MRNLHSFLLYTASARISSSNLLVRHRPYPLKQLRPGLYRINHVFAPNIEQLHLIVQAQDHRGENTELGRTSAKLLKNYIVSIQYFSNVRIVSEKGMM